MYLFRVNVKHDGQDFAKGDACPSDLVKAMLSQGLLEAAKGEVLAQPSEVQVEASAAVVSEVVSEESSDDDSEDLDFGDDESSDDEGESEEKSSDEPKKKKKKKGKK
jgi:hypothetical protein